MKRIFLCRAVLLVAFLGSVALFLVRASSLRGADQATHDADTRIAIEWKGVHPAGQIVVSDGALEKLQVVRGQGEIQGSDRFSGQPGGSLRLGLQIKGTGVRYGKGGTIVTVADKEHPFSFFLRDVNRDFPIYIPAYGVIVTTADDQRTYDEIARAIHARASRTKLQQIEAEPEETFADAAANTRESQVPTWLGLGRDMRIFEVDARLESIQPRDHGYEVTLPEGGNEPVRYSLMMGRGWGVVDKITRRLDEGELPILRGTLVDDDLTYEFTAFVTLESTPLTAQNVQGTQLSGGGWARHRLHVHQRTAGSIRFLVAGGNEQSRGDRALRARRRHQHRFCSPLCLPAKRVTQPRKGCLGRQGALVIRRHEGLRIVPEWPGLLGLQTEWQTLSERRSLHRTAAGRDGHPGNQSASPSYPCRARG